MTAEGKLWNLKNQNITPTFKRHTFHHLAQTKIFKRNSKKKYLGAKEDKRFLTCFLSSFLSIFLDKCPCARSVEKNISQHVLFLPKLCKESKLFFHKCFLYFFLHSLKKSNQEKKLQEKKEYT